MSLSPVFDGPYVGKSLLFIVAVPASVETFVHFGTRTVVRWIQQPI